MSPIIFFVTFPRFNTSLSKFQHSAVILIDDTGSFPGEVQVNTHDSILCNSKKSKPLLKNQ